MQPSDLPGDDVDEETEAGTESLVLGPEGINDPETVWDLGEPAQALPPLEPGQFLLLAPGEEFVIADALPKRKQFGLGLAISLGDIVVCVGRKRTWVRPRHGQSDEHHQSPRATRLVDLTYELARYANEPEFEEAHPNWVG